MKPELNVAILQSDIVSDEIQANLAHFEELIWDIETDVDLLVLPEAFNTGFDFKTQNIEPINLHTFKWMNQMAQMKQAYIVGSYFVRDKQSIKNRLYCVAPDGTAQYYDKHHLFSFSEEGEKCTKGNKVVDFNVHGWKIRASICFDLRFPVFLRNTSEYDVLLNVANWPAQRIEQYKTLAQARAIENQCFVITANRIGQDQKETEYNGQSNAYNFKGEVCSEYSSQEEILNFIFKASTLQKARENFPVLEEKDSFDLS